jgi:DNA-binding MarR family transcriptional regulator
MASPTRQDVEAVTAAVLTASRLLAEISARSLAARVTPPQFRMLTALSGSEETKLVTLAEALKVNPSTAMRMVDRLVSAHLIARRVNPASRREILLRLTPEGARVVEEVTARRREEIAAIVATMTPEARTDQVTALRAFTEAAGGPPLASRSGAFGRR